MSLSLLALDDSPRQETEETKPRKLSARKEDEDPSPQDSLTTPSESSRGSVEDITGSSFEDDIILNDVTLRRRKKKQQQSDKEENSKEESSEHSTPSNSLPIARKVRKEARTATMPEKKLLSTSV